MLNDPELLRYSRQILLDNWDIDAQIRLKNSTIAVVGMGGLGACFTPTLVRAGVGVVRIVDFDVIDESNLQRQPLYGVDDVGKPKVEVAKQALEAHNHLCQIVAYNQKLDDNNAKKILMGATLVIDCSDNFKLRYILNRACVSLGLPLLSLSAVGRVGQMSLFEPSMTGCYACLFGDTQTSENNCTTTGVLASTVSVVGAMGADVALSFLGQDKNPLANTLAVWQGDGLSLRKLNFQKNPNCTVCGK